MCTAITYSTKDHYFGRNLDLEYHYAETVTIIGREFPLPFRCQKTITHHYAMIGMATVTDNYPLYYDAVNEHGLGMAALNFPGNAAYHPFDTKWDNITPFELVPWILGQCKTVTEADQLLKRINLVEMPFNSQFSLTPLHWFLADLEHAVTIEPLKNELKIHENPVGVLTNNPPFDQQMTNLTNYLNLTREEPANRFCPTAQLAPYSRGMGAIGLPGDMSSGSRFVRAAFIKLNSECDDTEDSSISQFFHILDSVAQINGCVRVGESFEKTIYSSCCNMDKGIYYYTTYNNRQITGICLKSKDIESDSLYAFPLITKQDIRIEEKAL